MRQKTRILIYALIAVAVVILGTIAILSNRTAKPTAESHLDLGRIYLNDLSYDKAILEFKEAIEIDPNDPEPYIELANVYIEIDDVPGAVETLEKGLDETDDDDIETMLEELKNLENETPNSTDQSDESDTVTQTSSVATTESAPEASPAEDFDIKENEIGLTITKYNGKDTEVTIPSKIGGKPVTAIGVYAEKTNVNGAFENNRNITKVIIPEGVTEINAASFINCKNLIDIEFPESFNNITVQWKSYGAHETKIPFDGTPWLELKRSENPIVIVNNMVIDGHNCFGDVEIPNGVKKICDGAFNKCKNITSIFFSNGVEKIGEVAFVDCEKLTNAVFPDSVSYIGSYAFEECKVLENVVFPNGVVEMGEDIFGGCGTARLLLEFGQDINSALEATYFCPWLKNKILEDPIVIVNGNLIDGSMCLEDVIIPDSVKSIAEGAFLGCPFESVKLPKGIEKIPKALFSNCYNLKTIVIPNSVTEIGGWAFSFAGITNITIPSGVTSIGSGAFMNCTKLTSINISDSVTEIGYGAFSGCESLENLALPDTITKIPYSLFGDCKSLKRITIPDSVIEIEDGVFMNCSSLTSVTLPSGLKRIGSWVFSGSYNPYKSKLKELTLPDSLESISEEAFLDCDINITYKRKVYSPGLYDDLYKAING